MIKKIQHIVTWCNRYNNKKPQLSLE